GFIQFPDDLYRLFISGQRFRDSDGYPEYRLHLVHGAYHFKEERDAVPGFFLSHPETFEVTAVISRHPRIIGVFALQELVPDLYIALEYPGLEHHDGVVSRVIANVQHVILNEHEGRIYGVV